MAAAILLAGPWQWLFLVNLPLGLVALFVAQRTLPQTPTTDARFDWPSAFLSALTLGCLIMAVDSVSRTSGITQPLGLIVVAILSGTILARRQLGMPAPMLPVDLLRLPVFALSMATSICSFSAQMLAFVSMPFWLQDVLGRSEVETGLLLTPWPVATALTAPYAGRLADRLSPGKLGAVGLLILSAGLVLLIALPAEPSGLDIGWRMAVCGAGFGIFQSPNNKAIITSAPPGRSGGASGMQATARLVGQSIGAALAAVLFGLVGNEDQAAAALALAAGFSIIGACTSILRPFNRVA